MSDREERNRGELGGTWRRGGMQREMAGSRFGGYYARDDYDDGLGGDWTRDEPWRGIAERHGGASGRVSFRGRGPKNYRRSDDRILEEVNERLTDDHDVDASEIEVAVENGEVTLSGTVNSRHEKRMAEDVAESCHGVVDVHNRLRVADREAVIGKASE
jgi:hypothetical protein